MTPLRVVRARGTELENALEALLPAEPYLAYANFAPIAQRAGGPLELHRQRWRAAAD